MTKTRKMWIVFVGVMLLLFALVTAAYAVLDMLKLPSFPLVFDFDLSILSFLSFLQGYMLVAVLGLPALLLLIFAFVCFSRFKKKSAKYVVATIFGLLIEVAIAAWMMMSVTDQHSNTILIYIVVGAFPFLTLQFAIFSLLAREKQKEATEVAKKVVEIENVETVTEQEEPQEAEVPVQQPIYVSQPQSTPEPTPQSTEVAKAFEDKKFNPYYGSHGSEKVSDVVARVYGNQTTTVDEAKRKKLEKINQMFELGVINRFEYQQLTIRILNESNN